MEISEAYPPGFLHEYSNNSQIDCSSDGFSIKTSESTKLFHIVRSLDNLYVIGGVQ